MVTMIGGTTLWLVGFLVAASAATAPRGANLGVSVEVRTLPKALYVFHHADVEDGLIFLHGIDFTIVES